MDPITPAQFRTDFPAFANASKYPDALITLWATVAPLLLDANRWGGLYQIGQELFIAHNLVLDGMAGAEAARGGLVGFAKGPVSSESGDKVSVGYDTGAAMMDGAGHWNMSTYGIRYIMLVRMIGAGPVQVGPGTFQDQSGLMFPFMNNGLNSAQF